MTAERTLKFSAPFLPQQPPICQDSAQKDSKEHNAGWWVKMAVQIIELQLAQCCHQVWQPLQAPSPNIHEFPNILMSPHKPFLTLPPHSLSVVTGDLATLGEMHLTVCSKGEEGKFLGRVFKITQPVSLTSYTQYTPCILFYKKDIVDVKDTGQGIGNDHQIGVLFL